MKDAPAVSAVRQIASVPLAKLSLHPVLAGLPMCTQSQFEALCESIQKNGQQHPLTVVGSEVIDGRNRLAALKECGKSCADVVPAAPGTDPLMYALESAVTGRNLTKSGIVLFLFLKHPDLADERSRQQRRNDPKGGSVIKITTPLEKGSETFLSLAEKYRVPREYFSTLAAIHDAADQHTWEEVERAILAAEASIPMLKAGLAGKLATAGKRRADPKYHLLAPQISTTLCSVFKSWNKIDWGTHSQQHTKACQNLMGAFSAMPDEVRALNARAILDWPDHERADLLKALKSRSGK